IDIIAKLGHESEANGCRGANRFGEIRIATKAGRAIVDQLLSLEQSQIGAPQTIDLCEVMAEVAALLRDILPGTIALEVKCPRDLPAILIDRGHIEQVLLNLAFNARDAMEEGGALRIACEDSAAQNFVGICVTDTGCGIAASDLPRIFEPHFTTKRSG